MSAFWALTASAAIGATAWLYQKAWERHERRSKQYEEIIDLLPAFTAENWDHRQVDKAIKIQRRLWLIGPDKVVRAFNKLLAMMQGDVKSTDEERDRALGDLVIEMRRDSTLWAALVPRCRATLLPEEIKLRSAKRDIPRPS